MHLFLFCGILLRCQIPLLGVQLALHDVVSYNRHHLVNYNQAMVQVYISGSVAHCACLVKAKNRRHLEREREKRMLIRTKLQRKRYLSLHLMLLFVP